ncbi:uncharacterized protein A4U43_C07F34410 [Asparagus officinalis]|uniref:Uncharacterized protein n=1 Tax=Asparagus officinalis TaxID=4686 RepID=A0A5P1EM97_ASPOF|nr:transcription termination factor MTEF1, chloroplastic [Asparagus officinalis]ONK65170.1 uncharacterized protein A4U43_C07F34410 [Asparagus officinalis]
MPQLHSLFIPSSFSNSLAALTPKPSNLCKAFHHSTELSFTLPDLPTSLKEKIISLEIMGIDSSRALSLNPDLRDATPDSIHSVISYLQSKGIHHKDFARIFGMCPKILTSNVRSDLIPVFTFLSKDMRVPDNNFRKVINKCPRLLVSSVRDQLRPALIYLKRLGFKDTDALAYQDTVLLVSSVEKTLVPKLGYLMGLGLTREEAVGMVLRCPGLFTFSVENNFKPKHEYFVKEMGGSLEELKEFPQYFAFSLEKRIKPRYQETRERGVKMPLPVMLKSTDEEFDEMVQRQQR